MQVVLNEDIKEFLWQTERTTVPLEQLVGFILETPSFISSLIDISCNTADKTANWRAAWLLYKVADQNTTLIQPYTEHLSHYLNENYEACTPSQLRGMLRTLIPLTYNENTCEMLLHVCSQLFRKQIYPKAVRVNAMIVITNIVLLYPELKVEFISEFEILSKYDEKSIAAAARKQLARLHRLRPNPIK